MMEEILPTDIMEEILSRLPVKSLMRFRCVSKQWQNLFTNPDFVVKHMEKHPNPTHILEGKLDCFCSSKIESTKGEGGELIQSHKEWGSFPVGVRFQASCDGLVCLSLQTRLRNGSYETGIWLYNPATREKLQLPQQKKASTRFNKPYSFYGLGVNPITKEYKVVKITYKDFKGTTSVMIYTVGDGSHRWKHVCDSFPYMLAHPEQNTSVCVGGSVHWLAGPWEEDFLSNIAYNVIVSFDLHRQVLQEMPSLPFYQSDMRLCLGHLGGCLSVSTSLPVENSMEFSMELWVMKEYGVRESWTKVFRIQSRVFKKMNIRFVSSRGFFKDGRKILLMTDKTKPIVYNPEIKQMTKLETSYYDNLSYFEFFASFVETLVSLKVGSNGTSHKKEERGKRQLKRRSVTIDTPATTTEVPPATSVVAEGITLAISAADPIAKRPRRTRRRPANLQDYV